MAHNTRYESVLLSVISPFTSWHQHAYSPCYALYRSDLNVRRTGYSVAYKFLYYRDLHVWISSDNVRRNKMIPSLGVERVNFVHNKILEHEWLSTAPICDLNGCFQSKLSDFPFTCPMTSSRWKLSNSAASPSITKTMLADQNKENFLSEEVARSTWKRNVFHWGAYVFLHQFFYSWVSRILLWTNLTALVIRLHLV